MPDWFSLLTKPKRPAQGIGRDGGAPVLRLGPTGNGSTRKRSTQTHAERIKEILLRPRQEHQEHQNTWRFLLDSYEGGMRYRNAVYGPDRKGLPARNLIRHRREYPDPQMFPGLSQSYGYGNVMNSMAAQPANFVGPWPGMTGADPSATALDDDYELRRSRTPVPEFVAEAVEIHKGKIYDQEVDRTGPADLMEWWRDVDGRGTPMGDWMRKTVAPLLMVLGSLDICFDHPEAPAYTTMQTKADELLYGLDKCVASVILPENMIWWRTDQAGRYTECLVREYTDPADRVDYDANGNAIDPDGRDDAAVGWRHNYVQYRHWRGDGWTLYNHDASEVRDEGDYGYRLPPIVRLIDIPRQRTPHIGKSRYEAIAELQRAFYNLDSELILSNTLQAHPLLSGNKEQLKSENTITVGPGNVLPYGTDSSGNVIPWVYVSPDKNPADSLRKDKEDLVDAKDRRASLTKPAGTPGTTGGTVAQSGISKSLDAVSGNKVLGDLAKTLAEAERRIAEYALLVLRNAVPTPKDRSETVIKYPARFQLYSAEELIANLMNLQVGLGNLMTIMAVPTLQGEILEAITNAILVGLPDETYQEITKEIEQAVGIAKLRGPGIASHAEALKGQGASKGGGSDPSGQSAGTRVSSMGTVVVT